jgi:hypothetical protein
MLSPVDITKTPNNDDLRYSSGQQLHIRMYLWTLQSATRSAGDTNTTWSGFHEHSLRTLAQACDETLQKFQFSSVEEA